MNTSPTVPNPPPSGKPTPLDHFKSSLATVEGQLQTMAKDLMSGDAVSFEMHSRPLPQLLAELTRTHQALPPGQSGHRLVKSRLQALGAQLHQQRENMARRAALADRELNVLLPATAAPTYGGGVKRYGSAGLAGVVTSLRA